MEAFCKKANLHFVSSSLSITSSRKANSFLKIDFIFSSIHFRSTSSPKNSRPVDSNFISQFLTKLDSILASLLASFNYQMSDCSFPDLPMRLTFYPDISQEKLLIFMLVIISIEAYFCYLATTKAGTNWHRSQLQYNQGASSFGLRKIAVLTVSN